MKKQLLLISALFAAGSMLAMKYGTGATRRRTPQRQAGQQGPPMKYGTGATGRVLTARKAQQQAALKATLNDLDHNKRLANLKIGNITGVGRRKTPGSRTLLIKLKDKDGSQVTLTGLMNYLADPLPPQGNLFSRGAQRAAQAAGVGSYQYRTWSNSVDAGSMRTYVDNATNIIKQIEKDLLGSLNASALRELKKTDPALHHKAKNDLVTFADSMVDQFNGPEGVREPISNRNDLPENQKKAYKASSDEYAAKMSPVLTQIKQFKSKVDSLFR